MRITSIQLEIKDRGKEETVEHVLDLLERARGSDLVLLPELWPSGFFSFDRYRAESEPLGGPTIKRLGEKARELGAHVLAGSFVEADGERLFNTSVLLDDQGQIAARYRKMHLFGYESEEARLLTRGDEVVVVPTPWGRAGLSICYDLRFPELYRKMVDQGAEVLLLVAAWPAARREAWTVLSRARAIENQAFLFSCNGAGVNQGVSIAGHSLLLDPTGQVLAEGGDGEELLACEVDPNLVRNLRGDFPALRDRYLA